MSLSKDRITYLLEVWSNRKATAEEEEELFSWISSKKHEDAFAAHVEQLVKSYDSKELLPAADWDHLYEQIIEKRQHVTEAIPQVNKIPWGKWAAAAAILLVVAAGGYWSLKNSFPQHAIVNAPRHQPQHDIAAPAGSRATLTLPGGKIIVLDSTVNGSLALSGVSSATKLGNELVYDAAAATQVEWHTLNNPKGSMPVHLQLADGSGVWLNAASSITFPTVFKESARRVTMSGEAYFEVAKSKGQQFLVSANGTTTEVLGTHFNINAYENESAIQVTLLEGIVHVTNADQLAKLAPGQQASLQQQGKINIASNIDLDEVMAWKNNMFEFHEADIQSIMRQLERWYDVDVVYEDMVGQQFNGSIQRQVNVSRLLNLLEKTGGVRFTIEGKKVVVKK